MNKQTKKHLSILVESSLLSRFRYVSKYDDRSMNSLIVSLMRKHIKDFETTHGKITESQIAEIEK